ncbi:MAG: flp pilus-assembly TadE/G-like family protein [Micrococcales bacterium]|nr:flp pilus-assembly TadE/G-like family protein [Micrococcales bacterium]
MRPEEGSGSVLVVGALGALVAVLAGALVLAGAVRDVHRAQGAADLAALAAARPLVVGGAPDCGVAAEVAGANGAVLERCSVLADGSVVVEVVVRRSGAVRWPGVPDDAVSRARAGLEAVGPGP